MGMIWDNTKFDMKVNMSGSEYMKYKESRKLKLSKKQKEGIVWIGVSIFVLVILMFVISEITSKPVTPMFKDWYEALPTMSTLSWNNIGKLT
ncbi:unnamed protein product, partial [marine sediment metagenome]